MTCPWFDLRGCDRSLSQKGRMQDISYTVSIKATQRRLDDLASLDEVIWPMIVKSLNTQMCRGRRTDPQIPIEPTQSTILPPTHSFSWLLVWNKRRWLQVDHRMGLSWWCWYLSCRLKGKVWVDRKEMETETGCPQRLSMCVCVCVHVREMMNGAWSAGAKGGRWLIWEIDLNQFSWSWESQRPKN